MQVKKLNHIMPKLLTLSKCFTSLAVFINTFCSVNASMQLCYVMTDTCKLLTVFHLNSNEPIKVTHVQNLANQSINIKWHTCDREVTNISTLHQ